LKILDTTVVIDYLRDRPEAVTLLEGLVATNESVVASELVRFEVLAGARPSEIWRIEAFLGELRWVPVTEEVARAGAELAARYRKSHSGIDDVDYLIAGTVVLLDAELLTTNAKHFPMLLGLTAPY
jgi:predicted nucleic acid-binding protein